MILGQGWYFRDTDECPALCCPSHPFRVGLRCPSIDMAVMASMMHCVAAGVFSRCAHNALCPVWDNSCCSRHFQCLCRCSRTWGTRMVCARALCVGPCHPPHPIHSTPLPPLLLFPHSSRQQPTCCRQDPMVCGARRCEDAWCKCGSWDDAHSHYTKAPPGRQRHARRSFMN